MEFKGFTQDLILRIKEAVKFSAIELPVKEVVKLDDVSLVDGSVLSIDKMEVGSKAMFTGADGVAIEADGTFETLDGALIVCVAGLITEIKTKENEAPVAPEPVSEMTAILSRLEALEAKYTASQTQLSETKKHLGTALEAVEKMNSVSVALSLENQKPVRKSFEQLEPLERYRAIKSNIK